MALSLDDRVLGWNLGLGDLATPRGCWGYASCCNCVECIDREQNTGVIEVPRQPRQPWQVAI